MTSVRSRAVPTPLMLPGGRAQSSQPLARPLPRTAGIVAMLPYALIALVGIRLVEFLTFLRPIRPVLLLSVGGGAFLWSKTHPQQRAMLLRDPIFRLVVAYLLWACVTVLPSLWPGLAISTVKGLVAGTILVAAILLVPATPREVARITGVFVASTCIYVVLLFAMGHGIGDDRISVGMSLDANDAAAIFALCFPLALGLARTSDRKWRLPLLFGAGLLVFGIVATGSRGGTIGLLLGGVVYILGLKGASKLGYLVLLIGMGVAAWKWASPTYRERMTALVQGEKDYNYTQYTGRKQIWERGKQYWAENPFLGVGAGNFGVAEGERLKSMGQPGKWNAPHNAYLQAFVELGTPGGLIFLALLATAVAATFRLWRPRWGSSGVHRPEFLAAVVSMMASAYFLSHAYAYHVLIIFALTTLAQRAFRNAPRSAVAGPVYPHRMRGLNRSGPRAP